MQLLATEEFYLIKSVNTILKCCRNTSNLSIFYHSGYTFFKYIF